MPVAGGGFEQCYNAQAVVAADSLLVVATSVVQAANDKQQLTPMLSKVAALPEELGEVESMLADNGYFSAANVAACEAAGIEPVMNEVTMVASTYTKLEGSAANQMMRMLEVLEDLDDTQNVYSNFDMDSVEEAG